eukprot:CAMPEP_0181235850 /NCGR_PEP_ID=MMETSP1096-20121128/37817_1 /TAXON_ID=156174 ORGANISM="Chrysochromulina ericina, Strain CCMP281" /NCGR_SAMPLE_ID=MMETSP1096 /ASSEMBLY_ACC=CAM_ASM_000453 /LENGTH=61 /DNA_ID=CAMNT_0023330901 /DNA_START=304 /DNA_END=489 /DNA_ORIENTATION=-
MHPGCISTRIAAGPHNSTKEQQQAQHVQADHKAYGAIRFVEGARRKAQPKAWLDFSCGMPK